MRRGDRDGSGWKMEEDGWAAGEELQATGCGLTAKLVVAHKGDGGLDLEHGEISSARRSKGLQVRLGAARWREEGCVRRLCDGEEEDMDN